MTNVLTAPEQVVPALVYFGVMDIVAVSVTNPVLAAKNEGMSPLPLAAKPIAVLLFDQE